MQKFPAFHLPGNRHVSNIHLQSQRSTEQAVSAMPASAAAGIIPGIRRIFTAARMLHEREKSRLRKEITQVPGLMALLMKPRNGQKWNQADRAELRAQLRRLSRLGLYLTTAALPGTSLTLPLLAWWLDRRQGKRS